MSGLAERIRDMILTGDMRPGAKLDEQTLAERFDVSRTPVREALRQLASTGLIDLQPRRGAYVSSLTSHQRDEMFAAMSELEATCGRLAAMSMTPVERRNLQRMHESMAEFEACGQVEEFEQANEVLHSMICKGAHNDVLAEMTDSLRERLRPYRNTQFRTEGRLRRSLAEHDVIVRAVVSGDAARAHKAMLHHLGQAGDTFQEVIAGPIEDEPVGARLASRRL